jgi:hypothetical protein
MIEVSTRLERAAGKKHLDSKIGVFQEKNYSFSSFMLQSVLENQAHLLKI